MRIPIVLALIGLAAPRVSAHEGHEHASPEGGTSVVSITIEDGKRLIFANGLPDHPTGTYPNSGNPNRISAQRYSYMVTTSPRAAARTTPVGMNPFGITVNGVAFDPAAAEWWNNDKDSGWQYEGLSGKKDLGMDQNNAHVQVDRYQLPVRQRHAPGIQDADLDFGLREAVRRQGGGLYIHR